MDKGQRKHLHQQLPHLSSPNLPREYYFHQNPCCRSSPTRRCRDWSRSRSWTQRIHRRTRYPPARCFFVENLQKPPQLLRQQPRHRQRHFREQVLRPRCCWQELRRLVAHSGPLTPQGRLLREDKRDGHSRCHAQAAGETSSTGKILRTRAAVRQPLPPAPRRPPRRSPFPTTEALWTTQARWIYLLCGQEGRGVRSTGAADGQPPTRLPRPHGNAPRHPARNTHDPYQRGGAQSKRPPRLPSPPPQRPVSPSAGTLSSE